MAARRGAASAFSDTRYATDPSPCPDAPAVIVSHAALLEAVHAHSRDTLIETAPDPPAAAKLGDELVMEAWQRVAVGPATLVTAELPHAIAVKAAAAAANSRARDPVFTDSPVSS